jgi:hypothetical protein
MPDAAWPFKAAQEAALRGSAALQAAMGQQKPKVDTEPPTNNKAPYVIIGNDTLTTERAEGCAAEAEITSEVNWWSLPDPPDRGKQARDMGEAIVGALAGDAPLSVEGWETVEWSVESLRYVTDPDGSTHGIGVFTYQLTEQVA